MHPARRNILAAYLCGILYGVFCAADIFLSVPGGGAPTLPHFWQALLLMFGSTCAFRLLQLIFHDYLIVPLARDGIESDYYRYEPFTYPVFLLSAGVLARVGGGMPFASFLAAGLILVLAQAGLFVFQLGRANRRALVASERYVAALFLVSGFSALIYQIVWQRMLFTTFGVNSESVTVIVSVFMFGLGIGALAGGFLQRKYAACLLRVFFLLEVAIGLFGLISPGLIRMVSHEAGSAPPAILVLWVYAVLGPPTLLMGATLPVLVAFRQRHFQNTGKNVGLLYAFNTFGSAMAAFCTVFIVFVFSGLHSAILIAVGCNLATACLIFAAGLKRRPADAAAADAVQDSVGASRSLAIPTVVIALIAIGYISLSQEILWFRLLGYMTADRPQVFGLLLTAYLAGMAAGSLRASKFCESGDAPSVHLVRMLGKAAVVFYLAIPAIALATAFLGKGMGLLLAFAGVGITAFFTGGFLPLLIHAGTGNRRGGATPSVAWFYCANIVGATLGPLVTGFILLDWFTLESNVILLTGLTVLLLLALLLSAPRTMTFKFRAIGLAGLLGLGGWLAHPFLYRDHLERLAYASTEFRPFKLRLENRGGILAVEGGEVDVMYGNGIYDGHFNTDPLNGSNGIDRAYMVAALHRAPRKVLEIGLSTGSWTKVMTAFAPLQELTVVEINRGYPAIIRHYPEIWEALGNPKVNLVFDDGRRWLRNHPAAKFDLIVMNATFHWRSNTTGLLSKEFLELCKQHLAPNGVVYYNTTGSQDVIFTAAHVFNYVTSYAGFVAAGDAPFDMTQDEKRANLLQFRDAGGEAIFGQGGERRHALEKLVNSSQTDLRREVLGRKHLWLVTDDNMAVEYKAD